MLRTPSKPGEAGRIRHLETPYFSGRCGRFGKPASALGAVPTPVQTRRATEGRAATFYLACHFLRYQWSLNHRDRQGPNRRGHADRPRIFGVVGRHSVEVIGQKRRQLASRSTEIRVYRSVSVKHIQELFCVFLNMDGATPVHDLNARENTLLLSKPRMLAISARGFSD